MGQLKVLPRTVVLAWDVLFAACGAAAQDAVKVPPLEPVSSALTALISGQLCKGIAIDRNVFDRFLAEHGITAIELSSKGPYGAQVVSLRARLRRQVRRNNEEFCAQALAAFGPDGTVIRGVLRGL
jgi:hypothetical protein